MSRYELRRGARLKSEADEIWKRIEEVILPIATWLALDSDVALAAADTDAHLTRIGRRLDKPDLFLAATALAFDLVFVTRNVRHFANVPGLTPENWFPEKTPAP